MAVLKELISFPIIAAVLGAVITIYGTWAENEISIQTGGSVMGIAGTAYQVNKRAKNEDI